MSEEQQPTAALPVKSKKRFYILVAFSLGGAIILKVNFAFVFIGMLPAMVAYLIDHNKQKYIFSTVAALNFSGVFPDMMNIFTQGGTFEAVKSKLSDPFVWLTMYGAAGLGWALVWLSPLIAAMFLEGIHRGRIMHLRSIQKRLEEEWGNEVTRKSRGV